MPVFKLNDYPRFAASGDLYTKSFRLHQGGKGVTNSSGTNLTSRRLASGERQESLINPRELTAVSDWGERAKSTQRQLEG